MTGTRSAMARVVALLLAMAACSPDAPTDAPDPRVAAGTPETAQAAGAAASVRDVDAAMAAASTPLPETPEPSEPPASSVQTAAP